jgi:hypothetical protein
MSRKPKLCKEVILASSSVVVLVITTVLTSFITCGFDIKKMFSGENTFNMVTNASITIMGIVSSLPLGILTTKQRVNPDGSDGRYLHDFKEFHIIRKHIEPKRKYFGMWHSIQYAKECKEKQYNYLLKHNIIQPEYIFMLNTSQIKTLTVPRTFEIDGKKIYLNALTPRQIKACIKVLDGKVQVHKLPDFYFLYVDNISNLSFYDTAYTEKRDETKTVLTKIISKVALGFLVTCILTGFAHDLKDVMFTPTYIVFAVLLMLIRIFNALSSVYAGLSTGQEIVYRQCYYINGKTQFLKSFDTDNTFDPEKPIVPETHVVKELKEGA